MHIMGAIYLSQQIDSLEDAEVLVHDREKEAVKSKFGNGGASALDSA
jgi:hypothetical protein